MRDALELGRLVVSEVVWAETVAAFPSGPAAEQALGALGVGLAPTDQRAASLAGEAWRRYRRDGGPRSRVMADFLIAGHALVQADRLLTRDRGFLRTYFTELEVAAP